MATYPHQTPVDHDPFEDFDSSPGLSFATAQPGTVYKGVISRLPKELQDRDIATKKPKFWEDGQPQMCVVMTIDVETADGPQPRSIWAKKPSSMFRALGQAQKDAGQRFALGGTLYVRLERLEPSKTPGFSPQKIYAAKYEPPVVTDPWGAAPASSSGTSPAAPAGPAAPASTGPAAPQGWPTPTAQPAQPTLPGTPASKW
jgi:hypothetical protein